MLVTDSKWREGMGSAANETEKEVNAPTAKWRSVVGMIRLMPRERVLTENSTRASGARARRAPTVIYGTLRRSFDHVYCSRVSVCVDLVSVCDRVEIYWIYGSLCVSCAANHRLVLSVLAPIVWETART